MSHPISAETPPPLVFRGTAVSLGVARTGLYAIWFLFILRTDLAGLSHLPSGQYNPAGIMRIFGDGLASHFSAPVLGAFRIFLLVLTALLSLGIRPFRPFAIVGAVSLLFFDSLLKSHGSFINHGQVGILYASVAMMFFPASDALSVFRFQPVKAAPASVYRAAMAFPAFAFTLAYSFVGIRRLALGPEVLWNDSLTSWIATRTLSPIRHGYTWGLSVIGSEPLLFLVKAGFAVVTLCEVLAPWAVFNDRFRRFWLLVIVPFHFSTLFFMNIFFWENLFFILLWLTGFSYTLMPKLISAQGITGNPRPEAADAAGR